MKLRGEKSKAVAGACRRPAPVPAGAGSPDAASTAPRAHSPGCARSAHIELFRPPRTRAHFHQQGHLARRARDHHRRAQLSFVTTPEQPRHPALVHPAAIAAAGVGRRVTAAGCRPPASAGPGVKPPLRREAQFRRVRLRLRRACILPILPALTPEDDFRHCRHYHVKPPDHLRTVTLLARADKVKPAPTAHANQPAPAAGKAFYARLLVHQGGADPFPGNWGARKVCHLF